MRLYLECKPDEVLAVTLGVPAAAVIHSHGKGRVAHYLTKHSGIVGLVDEDPSSAQPRSFNNLTEISVEHEVKLKVDKAKQNRLIVLCPRLEPWLIKTAKASHLRMEEFSLSEVVRDLDAEINQRLPNIQRLVGELLKQNSARMLRLKSLLSSNG